MGYSRHIFRRGLVCRRVNRESKKVFSLIKKKRKTCHIKNSVSLKVSTTKISGFAVRRFSFFKK